MLIVIYTAAIISITSIASAARLTKRVVNGKDADIRDHPYQVALVTKDENDHRIVCGGAIVQPKLIFTAAHCTHVTDTQIRPNLSVLVGANSLQDPNGVKHEIAKIIKHPKFTYDVFDNDFSAVILKEPVKFNERVQPIKVTDEDHERGGVKGVVAGWGLTETGEPSPNLKSIKTVLEDWDKCQNHFPRPQHPTITENHICIKPNAESTTYGDSGGPLVIDGKLAGVVSFGRMVDAKRKATVFTRVKNFANAILKDFDNLLFD